MGNELIPAADADYQMSGPNEGSGPSSSPLRLRQFLGSLKKFWWIPLLTLAIGIAAGMAYVRRMEPVFVSKSSMWETSKLRLPDQDIYSDSMENVLGTQIELLQSEKLRGLALQRLESMTNSAQLSLMKDGQPPPITIQVNVHPKSSIFEIEAISSNPTFTQNYLDALMQAFLEYDKEVRSTISEVTLASINDQMQGLEQDLKVEQDALMAYERTNNLGILQEEESVAGGYLEKLQTQLSDLELEGKLLESAQSDSKQGTNGPVPLNVITALTPSTSPGTSPGRRHKLRPIKLRPTRLIWS